MKKRNIMAIAALTAVMAISGCGNKAANNAGGTATETKNTATDATEAYEVPTEYSPDLVDMKKIDGETLKAASDGGKSKGDVGNAEVEIGDAVVIDYDGDKVAVVSFEYKNNSGTEMPFTGSLDVEAYQDDNRLAPTVVVGVEGVTMLALSENVATGDRITVQMAYKLRNDTDPFTVEVKEFFQNENSTEGLSKTFEF